MLYNLPKNWCECRFSDVCYLQNGYAFDSKSYKEKGTYLIRISDIQNNEVHCTNCVKVTEEVDKCFTVSYGDFLLAMSGATTGKTGVYKDSNKALLNQRVGNLKIYDENIIIPKFRNYFISSKRQEIEKLAYGGAQPNISKSMIENLKMLLPPLEEQGRIVEKIEELFSDIDNGIKDLKTAQAQIKQYRQSVLKSAFEGKLYKTSEWKEVDIKKIISREKNALKAGPFGSALKKEIYVANGYKIYGQEQVISQNPFLGNYYINEEKYQQLISCSVKPLDILISLVGTIGKVLILPKGIEKGIINPRLIKVTLDVDQYLPAFFKLYFESQYLRSLFKTKAHGATMDVLNLSILKEIPFPLPTIPEQQQIVAEIEKRFAVADEMEKAVNDSLLQAEKLKQSILKQAFAGKLVPQNHNDEPAAVLLERIKAAKENSTKGKK